MNTKPITKHLTKEQIENPWSWKQKKTLPQLLKEQDDLLMWNPFWRGFGIKPIQIVKHEGGITNFYTEKVFSSLAEN